MLCVCHIMSILDHLVSLEKPKKRKFHKEVLRGRGNALFKVLSDETTWNDAYCVTFVLKHIYELI